MEYTTDKQKSIVLMPSLSWQNNNSINSTSSSTQQGQNATSSSITPVTLNSSVRNTIGKNIGFNFNNSLLLRHRFEKRGRTISLELGTGLSNRDANSTLNSENKYFGKNTSTQSINQVSTTLTNTVQLSANLVYT